MSAKRRRPVSALNVAAKIPGVATTAVAVATFYISETTILVLVSKSIFICTIAYVLIFQL